MTTKTTGRIVYIEPNDLTAFGVNIPNNNFDNITYKPEDMNMSVDLQVVMPYRDECGQFNIKDRIFSVTVNNNATGPLNNLISFMQGTKLQDENGHSSNEMTTSYLNASYTEVRTNDSSNPESLGIESIDVTFDSHFYPIVNIKFIDARGFSLMMPTEEDYRNQKMKEAGLSSGNNNAYANFFRAVFHFPYPMFLLTIKGFYGTSVTFMLAVNEFKNNFNSSTGNFEINISFIGYMYGLYTDIPMNALLVAPYIGCTSLDQPTNAAWDNVNYVYDNGNGTDGGRIKTFIEFIETYDSLMSEVDNIKKGESNYQPFNDLGNLVSKREKINEVDSSIKSLINDTLTKCDHYAKETDASDKYKVYSNKGGDIPYNTETLRSIIKDLKEFGASLSDFPSEDLPKSFNSGSDISTYTYSNTVDFSKLKNAVTEILTGIEINIGLLGESVKDSNNQMYETIIGFQPNIQNMFRMIFAHISCFMNQFYDVLDKIKEMKGSRTLSGIGVDKHDTDIKNDGFIPPFPGIYTQSVADGTSEQKLPTDIPNVDPSLFPEVTFCNDIINGIKSAKGIFNNHIIEEQYREQYTQEINETENSGNSNAMPTCLSDMLFDKNNPYSSFSITDLYGTDEIGGALLTYATLRMIQSYATFDKNLFNDNLGEIEAKNFLILHPNPNKKLKDSIAEINKGNIGEAIDSFYSVCNNSIKLSMNGVSVSKKDITAELNTVLKNDRNVYLFSKNPNNDSYFITEGKKTSHVFTHVDPMPYDRIDTILEIADKNDAFGEIPKRFYGCIKDKKINRGGIRNFTQIKDDDCSRFLEPNVSDDEILYEIAWRLHWVGKSLYPNRFRKEVFHKNSCIYALDYARFIIFANNYTHPVNNYIVTDRWDNNELNELSSYTSHRTLVSAVRQGLDNIRESSAFIDIINEARNPDNYETKRNGKIMKKEFVKKITDAFSSYTAFIYVIRTDIDTNGSTSSTYEGLGSIRGDNNIKQQMWNFIDTLNNAYKDKPVDEPVTKVENALPESNERDIVLALYNTLKNLYDKWSNSYKRDDFNLKSPSDDRATKKRRYTSVNVSEQDIRNQTEYDNFLFVDSFYNDISYSYTMSMRVLYDVIYNHLVAGQNYSVYEFIAEVCQKNHLNLIALPVYNNNYTEESIKDIFLPNKKQTMMHGFGTTYLCMYTYEPSHIVEDEKYNGMANDGFDLVGITDDPSQVSVQKLFGNTSSNNDSIDVKIPAFGVTYARQNQSYFTNIQVNMDNPRVTDYSIANLFELANLKADSDLNTPHMISNDIYSIYANRSYNCSVTMLGCANIMPMMYFQLNNIPMFRGAYIITNVRHHITPGQFTTTFTGQRISKNQLPKVKDPVSVESIYNNVLSGSSTYYNNSQVMYGDDIAEMYKDTTTTACETDFNADNAIKLMYSFHQHPRHPEIHATAIYQEKSLHYCAHWVRLYLIAAMNGNAATFPTENGVQWHTKGTLAKLYYNGKPNATPNTCFVIPANSTRAERIEWTKKNAKKGDVAVMYHGDHDYSEKYMGHICMYDGIGNWVADYNQSFLSGKYEMYVYDEGSQKIAKRPIYIYRYPSC